MPDDARIIEDAYAEALRGLFGVLFDNLITETEEEAAMKFMDGKVLLNRAREMAISLSLDGTYKAKK